MLLRFVFILVLFLLGGGYSYSQTFDRFYQIDDLSAFRHFHIENSNYVVAGVSSTIDSLNEEHVGLEFYRLDASGNVLQSSVYKMDSFNITANRVNGLCYPEGLSYSYALAGVLTQNGSDERYGVFLGFDSNFNNVKQTVFDFSDSLQLRSITYNEQVNEFILTGTIRSPGEAFQDLYIAKADTNGVLISDTTYGGIDDDVIGNTIWHQGNLIMSCETYSFANMHPFYVINASNGHFVSISPEGAVQWETTLWNDGFARPPILFENGLFVHSIESPPSFPGNLYKRYYGQIDLSDGSLLWTDTLQNEEIRTIKSIKETPDGGYLVLYWIKDDNVPGGLMKLRKLNAQKVKVWDRIYSANPVLGVSPHDMLVDNNNILVWGGIFPEDNPKSNSWLLKMDLEGCLSSSNCGRIVSVREISKNNSIRVIPNPCIENCQLEIITENLLNQYLEVLIYDIGGNRVYSKMVELRNNLIEISSSTMNLPKGVYTILLNNQNNVALAKDRFVVN